MMQLNSMKTHYKKAKITANLDIPIAFKTNHQRNTSESRNYLKDKQRRGEESCGQPTLHLGKNSSINLDMEF